MSESKGKRREKNWIKTRGLAEACISPNEKKGDPKVGTQKISKNGEWESISVTV